MSAEMWDEGKVLELDNEYLLEDCIRMADMLDEVEALIVAYQKTSDARLLNIALQVIGAGGDEDE
jgi:hypothetical protein